MDLLLAETHRVDARLANPLGDDGRVFGKVEAVEQDSELVNRS
jgi:hypothetical protein